MHKLLLAVTVMSSFAGCVASEGDEPETIAVARRSHSASLDGWTVTAHEPTLVGDDMVAGSFTFERMSGAELRGGGACLIADIYPGGFECQNYVDCDKKFGIPNNGFNYCVDVNRNGHRRCWARPSGPGCVRSRDYPEAINGMLPPGTYDIPPVSGLVDGKWVKWITYGCLAAEAVPTGCGSRSVTPPTVTTTSSKFTID